MYEHSGLRGGGYGLPPSPPVPISFTRSYSLCPVPISYTFEACSHIPTPEGYGTGRYRGVCVWVCVLCNINEVKRLLMSWPLLRREGRGLAGVILTRWTHMQL